jgi:hypothetical protein
MEEHKKIILRSLGAINHAGTHLFVKAEAMNLKSSAGLPSGDG